METVSQGTNSSSFAYDPEHRRILQQGPSGTTAYFWSPHGNFEGTPSGGWRDYIMGPDGMIAAGNSTSSGGYGYTYFQSDYQGSVTLETNKAGAVQSTLAFDAWGKRRQLNGTDDPTDSLKNDSASDRNYTGEEALDDVGLMHLNARLYDPYLGRFTRPDPSGIQGGKNLFAYGGNNPITERDPTGLDGIRPGVNSALFTGFEGISAPVTDGQGPLGDQASGSGATPVHSLAQIHSINLRSNVIASIDISIQPTEVTLDTSYGSGKLVRQISQQEGQGDTGGASKVADGGVTSFPVYPNEVRDSCTANCDLPVLRTPDPNGSMMDPLVSLTGVGTNSAIAGYRLAPPDVFAGLESGRAGNVSDTIFGIMTLPFGGEGFELEAAEEAVPLVRGGVYALRDAEGVVMRTGRTGDLARRAAEHARDPLLKDFSFDPIYKTDVYAEQRGLEQILHDTYNPSLNKINPINPANPRFDEYMNAARDYLSRTGQ